MTAPPSRLSAHFDLREFDCRDGTRVPASKRRAILYLVEWWLEPFRHQFGRTTIISGYRTSRHNAAVGGARASVHMLRTPLPSGGQRENAGAAAADVQAERGNAVDWAAWARIHRARHGHLAQQGRGGIGTYRQQNFVHLDTAGKRDWTG